MLGIFDEGLFNVACFAGELFSQREGLVELQKLEETLKIELSLLIVDKNGLAGKFLAHCVEHLGQRFLYVDCDGVFAQFWGEEF